MKDIVYHVGDFSRRSEPLSQVLGGGRDTGYFGTGHYFTTEWEYCRKQGGGDRPLYSINISDYNLMYGDLDLHKGLRYLSRYMNYYPYMKLDLFSLKRVAEDYMNMANSLGHRHYKNESFSEIVKSTFESEKDYHTKDGISDYSLDDFLYIFGEGLNYSLKKVPQLRELYDALETDNPNWKKIDQLVEVNSDFFNYDLMSSANDLKLDKPRMCIYLGVNESKFDKICEDIYLDLKKYYIDNSLELNSLMEKMDSIPTMFIKALGYDGIYPSSECDNITYGGCLFSMDKAKDVTLLSNNVSGYPENALAEPLQESLSFEQLKKEVVPDSKANEHLNYFYKQRNKLNGQGNRNIKYVASEFNDEDGSMTFLFRTDATFIDEPKKELANDNLNDGELVNNISDEYALQLKICDFWDVLDLLLEEGDVTLSKNDMKAILELSEEVRIGCNCGSQYWMGGDFWLSQIDAELKPCTIRPKFWNSPNLRGETKVCKHLLSLLNHISFFLPQMAMGSKAELKRYGLL